MTEAFEPDGSEPNSVSTVNKMPRQKGTLTKGALRYAKLRAKVEAALPEVRWWFIATSAPSGSPWDEVEEGERAAASVALLFAEENVVAVTHDEVVVMPLKGPGVFGMGVDTQQMTRAPIADVTCAFEPTADQVVLDGQRFNIFTGHEYEALHLAACCGAAMPTWYVPA